MNDVPLRITIAIPSLLHPRPAGGLWLERALGSVRAQTLWGDPVYEPEIVVSLSPGVPVPRDFPPEVRFVNARAAGQGAAMNAAVAAAGGDLLAVLEDDDAWEPGWLAEAAPLVGAYGLVTGNQLEVTADDAPMNPFDFPTPSSWVMPRELWPKLGGMDEAFDYHLDTEFLGKVNAAGVKRIHLTDRAAFARQGRWLAEVARWSTIAVTRHELPLVRRTHNPSGMMSRIRSDPGVAARSRALHDEMRRRYGCIPW